MKKPCDNLSATQAASSTLYFAHHINNDDERFLIGGMGDVDKEMSSDNGESPEETRARLGEVYEVIQGVFEEEPSLLSLDADVEYDNKDLRALSRLLLSDVTPRFLSPHLVDYSVGGDVQFFSSADLLILPPSFTDDLSGTYELEDVGLILLRKVGNISGCMSDAVIEEELYQSDGERIYELLMGAFATIKQAFREHCEDIRMFMLDEEWTTRDEFSSESLPQGIHFSQAEGAMEATAPDFMSYGSSMQSDSVRLAYYNTRNIVASWFGVNAKDVRVNLDFPTELVGFKIADNVWVESLRDSETYGFYHSDKENRFWWSHDYVKALPGRVTDVATLAGWIREEGADSVAYYSLMEHHAGDDVAYAVSVFNGRKSLFSFTISAFDVAAGYALISALEQELKVAPEIRFVQSGAKEDNWDVEYFGEDFDYLMPAAPALPVEKFAILGVYLKVSGSLVGVTPKMLDVKEVPELLSLGINAPLPFSGVISSPCYVRTDDMRKPLFQAERIVKEAHEDGIALANPDFAQKIAFEFANCSNAAKDVYVFSLVVLNISDDTLMNYVMSGDFPVGKLDNPALISRFNKLYPHLGVTNIALAPHIK